MQDYDFDNLAQFDEAFVPAGIPNRIDSLVPGDYSAVINSAKLDRLPSGETIVKWLIFILDGPVAVRQTVEHTSWLTDSAKVGRVGAELLVLGIDTVSWLPPDRPFSRMLPPALLSLAGRKCSFRVSQYMNKKKGILDNNLRFSGISPATMGDQSSLPF